MSAQDEQTRTAAAFRYEVLERLGGGAHGEGFLARRPGSEERVFLKVLRHALAQDPEWRKRFCDEVALLRSCVHPHIVRYVEAYEETGGELCLVTEYLEGENLAARLRKSGPLPARHVLALARPLCDALAYLHGRGVVHRDLTPGNILVSGRFPDVVPRLLDFGLAWSEGPRQAQTGATLALTPVYAAPECLQGARATAAADVYALGVILWEALTGAPPHAASSVEELLAQQQAARLAPLPASAAPFAPVLRRCLAARPEERFASATALARALEEAADHLAESTRVEGLRPVRPPPPPGGEEGLGSVGSYQLLRVLGAGGMGKVYLARHVRLGRQVAIKMLLPEALADRDSVARFFNEARTVNAINHEHIVEIFDFVEEEGPTPRVYCVMELLVGASLAQLHRSGPLPLRRILHICRQVADALAAAHRAGVVHRDVKPANIFVTTRSGIQDYVKVLDFGVAKVNAPLPGEDDTPAVSTRTGLALGTPDYMSPEQVTASAVDGRTDVYALGVLLFELLAGRRPFQGSNLAHLVVQIVKEPPAPLPSSTAGGEPIPPQLTRLVRRCLEKRPEARPQSMEEVAAALEHLLQALSAPATVPTPAAPGPATPLRARRGLQLGLGAGALALLAGVGLLALRSGPPVPAPAALAPTAPTPAAPAAAAPAAEAPTAVAADATEAAAVAADAPVPTAPAAAPAAAAPAPEAARLAAARPAPAARAPAATVALRVRSRPSGATLVRTDSGERLGVTPLTVQLPRQEAPLRLRLELAGHAPREKAVALVKDVDLSLSLTPLSRRARPARSGPARLEDPDAPLDPFAAD